jgi:hypothetical protein
MPPVRSSAHNPARAARDDSAPWLERELARRRSVVESALEHWLPADDEPPARLHEAMRYAVLIKEVHILDELEAGAHGGETERSETVDISSNGARLRCGKSYPPEALLELEFDIPDWHKYSRTCPRCPVEGPAGPLSVLAKPVWSRDAGGATEMGLRFVRILGRHRQALKRLVDDKRKESA